MLLFINKFFKTYLASPSVWLGSIQRAFIAGERQRRTVLHGAPLASPPQATNHLSQHTKVPVGDTLPPGPVCFQPRERSAAWASGVISAVQLG